MLLLNPVLKRALDNGASNIEVSRMPLGLRWYRGKNLLERDPLTLADFSALGEELRALGARGDRATDVVAQTPLGAIPFSVKFSNIGVQLTFPVTEAEAEAEVAFSELVGRSLADGASHVICRPGEAVFKKESATTETVTLVEGAYEMLLAHGRKLARIEAATGQGTAVVFGPAGQFAVDVTVTAVDVTFALKKTE